MSQSSSEGYIFRVSGMSCVFARTKFLAYLLLPLPETLANSKHPSRKERFSTSCYFLLLTSPLDSIQLFW